MQKFLTYSLLAVFLFTNTAAFALPVMPTNDYDNVKVIQSTTAYDFNISQEINEMIKILVLHQKLSQILALPNVEKNKAHIKDNYLKNIDLLDTYTKRLKNYLIKELEYNNLDVIENFLNEIEKRTNNAYVIKSFYDIMSSLKAKLNFQLNDVQVERGQIKFYIGRIKKLENIAKSNTDTEELISSINSENINFAIKKSESRKRYQTKKVSSKKSKFTEKDFSRLYSTKKLGANYSSSSNKTAFSLFAPRATKVILYVYNSAKSKKGTAYEMKIDSNGVWSKSVPGCLYGKFYNFSVDGPEGRGERFKPDVLISDPYARANVDHNGKSIVVNPAFKWSDKSFKTPAIKDAIVYELHVKDFTAHSSSGVKDKAKKGKYLGLGEGANSDILVGHLKKLGVNAVELLPVHEFDNHAAPPGHVNYWGYMTSHYFAPESCYATSNTGAQVKELKQAINKLHKNGIGVILDVVYNHTTEGNEYGPNLNLKGIDNKYYYRLCQDPMFYWNGTGCGNELRSETPMTRKLILDSLKSWVKEYHVDGFRFDLCTILDKKTMMAINDELPKKTMLIAEPWTADWNRNQWGKGDFKNTKWAKWNDDYKKETRKFLKGRGNRDTMMTLQAGSCFWWAGKPTESVNFLECHDNDVLNDHLDGNKKQFKLGAITLLTSAGVPMLQSGQEFMRTKKGNDNSYDQDNSINYINWNLKKKNKDVYDLYSGLINLRKKHLNFRHDRALNNSSISWIKPGNGKAFGYVLKGSKYDFAVLLNSNTRSWVKFDLPEKNRDWTVITDGNKFDEKGLYTARGDYSVPPSTGIILKISK